MNRLIFALFLAAIAVVSVACGGGGKRSHTTLPKVPHHDPLAQLQEDPKSIEIPAPKLGDGSQFSDEDRRFMNIAFRAFMREENGWVTAKKKWLGLGAKAEHVLVENLFVYMLAAQSSARPYHVERTKGELVSLADRSVAPLVATLQIDTFTDRTGRKQRVDSITKQTSAEILVLIGTPKAVNSLIVITSAPSVGSRRVAVRALAGFDSARSIEARLKLLADANYQVVAEAAWSLRTTDPDARVSRALVDLFGNRSADRFAREKAGQSLMVRRDKAAVPMLVDLLERAIRQDDIAVARESVKILRRTTGLRHGIDARAWRAALREG